MKFSTEEWAELAKYLDEALDVPAAEQDRWVDELTDLAPALKTSLKEMLRRNRDQDPNLIDTLPRFAEQPNRPGQSSFNVGRYTLIREIGRGGMGTVWLADRSDGAFNRRVALKLPHFANDTHFLERFRRERDILAAFTHPNIAQIYDAGVSSDGQPFIALEYVEGSGLLQYCDRLRLGVRARLALFLQVLRAVQYAHSHLVIHRDLKPGNIMVGTDGNVKLLDFGIAKIMSGSEALETELTQVGGRALTLDYASPEQILGQPMSTASDVYSLGVILCELLTGIRPYSLKRTLGWTPEQALETLQITRPSQLVQEGKSAETQGTTAKTLARWLRGDLDTIVLKALKRNPAERYTTADTFAQDIERYLRGEAVLAQPESLAYRARKFVLRHRLPMATGAVAMLAIMSGAGVSVYQAQRAERRFAQVRVLANRFVFDFEAAIRTTPGTLEARRMVAATGREYLASLAEDAGNNYQLKRELAQAYYRLSKVESNAGEDDSAIEHLKRSLEIQKAQRDDCCGPALERSRYIDALSDLAYTLEDTQSPKDSVKYADEAVRLARDWSAHDSKEPLARRALLNAISTAGSAYGVQGRYVDGRKMLEEAVKLGDTLLQQNPSDTDLKYNVARTRYWLADAVLQTDGPVAAEIPEQDAKRMIDDLLQRNPENMNWRYLAITIDSEITRHLKKLQGKDPELQRRATESAQAAYALARANARQNPGNGAVLDDSAVMAMALANQLSATKRTDEALPYLQEAGATIEQLRKIDPSDRRYLYMQANNQLQQGAYYSRKKLWSEVGPHIQEAEATLQEIRKKWPSDLRAKNSMVTVLLNRTDLEYHSGHLDKARETCRSGLALAVELIHDRKGSKDPVEFLGGLRAYAKLLQVADPTEGLLP